MSNLQLCITDVVQQCGEYEATCAFNKMLSWIQQTFGTQEGGFC